MRSAPTPPPQQPNVQATDINMFQNIVEHPPQAVIWSTGLVDNFTLDYSAYSAGVYTLNFRNDHSSTTMNISLSYVAAGKSFDYIEVLPVGVGIGIPNALSTNQRISGQFIMTGGSPNVISFNLTAQTCNHTIDFNFTLVNTGTANGNATVNLQNNGMSYWQHSYLVAQGQHVPESGSATLPDCVAHTYSLEVTGLEKT